MSNRTKGNLILLLAAVLWGSGFISQKMGNEILPPITFNALRQLMAFIVLIPFTVRGLGKSNYLSRSMNSEAAIVHRRSRLIMAGLFCGMFMLVGTVTQQIGLVTVSAGKSGFISAVYIVLVPLFSALTGDKVSAKSVLCILLAMAGFAVMSLKEGFGGATAGDWFTLVSAAGFAAQIVAVHAFIDKDNALLISEAQMLFAGTAGLVIALITEQTTLGAVWLCMPVLLYQTLVPTAVGYTLQIVGQKHTEPSTAALIMSLEAVFAAIFGALILREIMSARELTGCAIILAATIIGQR